MKKLVIYTSLVGNIDKLLNPSVIFEDCDYICFSNNIVPCAENNVWDIKKIPFHSKDSRVTSRYPKILPHKLLNDYEYSLWVDSNLIIQDLNLFKILNNHILNDTLISLVRHPVRDCIYDEAEVCVVEGKVNYFKVKDLISFLSNQGFPRHFGLFENGLMLRKHSDPNIIRINEEWWGIYLKYVKRDQLSLCYLLWKYNITCVSIFQNGVSVRNSSMIKYNSHSLSIFDKINIKGKILLNKLLVIIK